MFIDEHHIVPKHRGGGDDPSNLIHLPRWAHAEVHHRLWAVYGELSDLYAAHLLGYNLSETEQKKIYIDQQTRCKRDTELLARGRRNSTVWRETMTSEEYRAKMKSSSTRLNREGRINSPEARKKISEIKRQKGNYNAKQISIDGVQWRSVNEYVRANPTGLTARQIRSRAVSTKHENIFYVEHIRNDSTERSHPQ
jgi:hypothetical protein